MACRDARLWSMAALALVPVTACTQTSRVDDRLTAAALAQSNKAVAVMRVGSASPNCIHVAVLLGVREGNGYRRHKGVVVANVRSLTEPAVAEVELDPGEYHVLAYRCQGPHGIKTLHDNAGGQLYRTSFASFALGPGEIVNVGYLHVGAWRVGRSAFGRPVEVDIEVTDWPLHEIDLFKAKRPHIYAQMKTRLMKVMPLAASEPGEEDCARLKALQAEGKVQRLPSACTRGGKTRKMPAAVANSDGNE
jgi:hypothetical protein